MKNAFEEIRAERERPLQGGYTRTQYTGLWQQIALGIVVGYTALGVLACIAWAVATKFILGNLQLITP